MSDKQTPGEQPLTMSVLQHVKTLRIISLALVLGVCTFGMVVLSQAGGRPAANANSPEGQPEAKPAQPLGMMSFVAVGVMVICGTLSTLLPRIMVKAQLHRLASDKLPHDEAESTAQSEKMLRTLLRTYQSQHIIRSALLEAPAFLGLIAYWMEGHAAVLVVPAVSIGLLLVSMPSVGKVTVWVEEHMMDLLRR